MINSKLILNLVNPGTKVNHSKFGERGGAAGGWRKSLLDCMPHSEIPKETIVQLPTTKKQSGQVSLSSLSSVKGLML